MSSDVCPIYRNHLVTLTTMMKRNDNNSSDNDSDMTLHRFVRKLIPPATQKAQISSARYQCYGKFLPSIYYRCGATTRQHTFVSVIGDVCEYGWIGKHGWNTRPLWAPSNVIWATKQLLPKTVFLRWTDFTSSSTIKLHMIIMFDDVFYGFCSCFIMWQRMMMIVIIIIIIIHNSDIN